MIGYVHGNGWHMPAIDLRKAHSITIISDTWGASIGARIIIDGTIVATGAGRGTDVYRFKKSDLTLTYHGHWDTYGSTGTANNAASEINNTGIDEICMCTCGDANTKNGAMNSAMQALGGTATNTWSASRTAFCFIGVRGAASGKAIYRDAGGDAQNAQWGGVLIPCSYLGYTTYNGVYYNEINGILQRYEGQYNFFGY